MTSKRVVSKSQGQFGFGQQTATYYQIIATIGARLVKIDDNMVMWTGDFGVDAAYASQEQDTVVLGGVAETIAVAFPQMPKKN